MSPHTRASIASTVRSVPFVLLLAGAGCAVPTAEPEPPQDGAGALEALPRAEEAEIIEAAAAGVVETVLATIPFGAEDKIEFVEAEPGIVSARTLHRAITPSRIDEAFRELEPGLTVVQAYDRLAGAAASPVARARLAEAAERLGLDVGLGQPMAAEGLEAEESELVYKALPTDNAWFEENFCWKISFPLTQRAACYLSVAMCGYGFTPEHVNSSSHYIHLFNQEDAGIGKPNVQGLLQYRVDSDDYWSVGQGIDVPPRHVYSSLTWTGMLRRRTAVGFRCSMFSLAEYWTSRR